MVMVFICTRSWFDPVVDVIVVVVLVVVVLAIK